MSDVWVPLLFIALMSFWCPIAILQSRAIAKVAPYLTGAVLIAAVPLVIDLCVSTPSMAGINAIKNMLWWSIVAGLVVTPMWLSLVFTTVFRERGRIWGNSPDT